MAQSKTTARAVVAATDLEVPPYSMHIVWDPDDRIFVVTVPELPGCMTHGDTYEEAASKGREAIASWLGAAEVWGTPIPAPRVERYILDDAPPAPVLSQSEVAWRYVDSMLRLMPDIQNAPDWVLEEFRSIGRILAKLSPEDQAVIRGLGQTEQSRNALIWLAQLVERLSLAQWQLTGTPPPPLPTPGPSKDEPGDG
jgi:predicted RNase H-like HicB family nuclease